MTFPVPLKLLHESIGHIVTVELETGVTYRGLLQDAEDSMNLQLVGPKKQQSQTPATESTGVLLTHRNGSKEVIEHVYIRGSDIRLVVVPDMLRSSPIFHTTKK